MKPGAVIVLVLLVGLAQALHRGRKHARRRKGQINTVLCAKKRGEDPGDNCWCPKKCPDTCPDLKVAACPDPIDLKGCYEGSAFPYQLPAHHSENGNVTKKLGYHLSRLVQEFFTASYTYQIYAHEFFKVGLKGFQKLSMNYSNEHRQDGKQLLLFMNQRNLNIALYNIKFPRKESKKIQCCIGRTFLKNALELGKCLTKRIISLHSCFDNNPVVGHFLEDHYLDSLTDSIKNLADLLSWFRGSDSDSLLLMEYIVDLFLRKKLIGN